VLAEEQPAKSKPETKEQKSPTKINETIESLSTGLKLYITEEVVKRAWGD